MKNEAHARIKINQLLSEAGWRFFDSPKGPANILLENSVKISQHDIDEWGNDCEKIKGGSLDFLLLDNNGKPLCVLEAKKESLHPLVIEPYFINYILNLDLYKAKIRNFVDGTTSAAALYPKNYFSIKVSTPTFEVQIKSF